MKVSTRRIRERLEEDYPKIQWFVRKVKNRPSYLIRGSIYRHKRTKQLVPVERLFERDIEELHATQIVTSSILESAFADILSDIGSAFYRDMREKTE